MIEKQKKGKQVEKYRPYKNVTMTSLNMHS